jgi:hypothetical protein
MRYKEKPEPQPGDIRTRTRFLFIPTLINHEWRWLEPATWKERYMSGIGSGIFSVIWHPICWVDDGTDTDYVDAETVGRRYQEASEAIIAEDRKREKEMNR